MTSRNGIIRGKYCGAAICALILTGATGLEAVAQIEEIVVTAQRRAQSLSDVPVSVSAYSAESLEELGATRPGDLMDMTPGLSGRNVGGTFVAYNIRGISSNVTTIDAEASVGIFIDGMYVGRFGGGAGAMFDMERVEILKGPQSTMFGRNSSAGAISLVTKRPTDELSAGGVLRYGSRNTREAEMVLNLPLSDNLAVRFASRTSDTDGYANYALTGNPIFDDSTKAARLSVRYEPTASVTFDLSADYEDSQLDSPTFPADDRPLYAAFTPTGTFDDISYNNVEDTHFNQSWGVNGRLSVDLGNGLELQTLTGFRSFDNTEPSDLDGVPVPAYQFVYKTGNEAFFQDIRLHGESEAANWFIGASYWKEKAYGDTFLGYNEIYWHGGVALGTDYCAIFSGVFPNDCFDGLMREDYLQEGETETYSIYGDLIYSLTDRLNIGLGLRYAREEKEMRNELTPITIAAGAAIPTFGQIFGGSTLPFGGALTKFVGVVNLSESYESFQPRLSIDYSINDNHMIYGSIGRGFKSGGFNSPLVAASRQKFAEESSWSYEVGLKSTIFDGQATWNSAFYYYEYEDYQDRTTQAPSTTPFVTNAALVEGIGFESELNFAVSDMTDLMLNGTYNSIEYGEYDDQVFSGGGFVDVSYEGNRLPYTPELSVSAAIRHTAPVGEYGELITFVMYSYNSEIFFNRTNTLSEDPVGLLSGRLTYVPNDANWSIGLFGNNILDEEYTTTKGSVLGAVVAKVGRPQTFGFEFKLKL
jgi:iron complex outermembrane recepter protein